jgi:hypothetical protein
MKHILLTALLLTARKLLLRGPGRVGPERGAGVVSSWHWMRL